MYEIFEKLLKKHRVTAYKVSRATGITTATLSNWKNGKSKPKQEKMQKIADYFGVTLDYLYGRDEQKETDAIVAHFGGDEYTEDELEEIRQFAEFVKNRKKKLEGQ